MMLIDLPSRRKVAPTHLRVAVALLLLFLVRASGVSGVTLEGSCESAVRVDWQTGVWAVDTELRAALSGAAWELEGLVEIVLGEWKKLDVGGSVVVAGRELAAKITFDPSASRFEKLSLEFDLEVDGWEIGASFDLSPSRCWTDLRAQYELGAYKIDVKTRLGASKAFCFDFYRTDVTVSFEHCEADVDVCGRFTAKKGFEWIDVTTSVPLPGALSGIAVETNARLSLSEATLSLEPDIEIAMVWEGQCAEVELLGEMDASDPLGVHGVRVVGIVFDASFGDAWIEGGTSFDPDWNKKVTGHTGYGRSLGIGFASDDGCAWGVSCEARAYCADSTAPLGWDRAVAAVAVRASKSCTLSLTTSCENGRGAEIAVGWNVEW